MDKKAAVPAPAVLASESNQGSLDNDRYIPLFSSCFVALKSSSLYPPGHQNIKTAVEQAHKVLVKELNNCDPLIFGVAKDVLIFNEVRIGQGVHALTAFAKTASMHGIVTFSFRKGIEKESLLIFFQCLCQRPDEAAGEDGFQNHLLDAGCTHIDIATVDYDLFQLSGKSGEDVVGAAVRKGRRGSIWMTFTRRLMRGGFKKGRDGGGSDNVDEEGFVDAAIDPVQLARFINDNKLELQGNIQNYGVMLDGILGATMEGGGTGGSDVSSVAPGSKAGTVNAEELSMVVTMLDELNPTLRSQFLGTTLDKCQKNKGNSNPEKLLSQLSSTLVFEMLDIANEADREISPALLSLIQGLSPGGVLPGTGTSATSPRQIKTLMARERHEDYVVPEYDELLKALGTSQNQFSPPSGFFLHEHEKTLTELALISQVTRLILVLMDEVGDPEEYRRYGQKLIEITCELPSLGAFALVDTISCTLKRHVEHHSVLEIRDVAAECLERIEGSDFLESIAALLPDASGEGKDLAVQALMARGPRAVSELLDYYCDEDDSELRARVDTYFQKHRIETLAEIVRRMPQEKRKNGLMLLGIITVIGVGGAAPLLRPMLSHYDDEIRFSALEILLPLQDDEAVQYLHDMLKSSEESMVAKAMQLAGKHRVSTLVPVLTDFFDYRCLQKTSIERNSRILLVLAAIADPAALPALDRLTDSNWIFHASQVAEMKSVLYISLRRYPIDTVVPLCKKGLKSKQADIKNVCRQILAESGRGQM